MSAAPVIPLPVKVRITTLATCARCNRVDLEGRWVSETEAIRLLRSFEDVALPSFATATCGPCASRVERRRARAAA